MQRKNYILKSKKNGFAMLMAIVVLLVLATMMAVSISLTTKTTKRNLNTYVKNQAELYSKNAAEYALYKISKSTTKCSPVSIAPFTVDGIYKINVKILYAYSNEGTCSASSQYIQLQDAASEQREYGYVKIDVTVEVDKQIDSEPIRIYRSYIEDITPYL
jgi:glyceraldehyde-3-phosphate dehydrogenase/erythrose-4-phosphate dehydrogenase